MNQVDEDVAVPRLRQPALGRALRLEPRVGQRLERTVDILLADHEVEVLAGLRSATRPCGEATPERKGNLRVAQYRADLFQGLFDPLELLAVTGHGVLVPE